jgi:diazepam-binding inhibitor (GABA receptor modulating acyl-CoA-binding protein)
LALDCKESRKEPRLLTLTLMAERKTMHTARGMHGTQGMPGTAVRSGAGAGGSVSTASVTSASAGAGAIVSSIKVTSDSAAETKRKFDIVSGKIKTTLKTKPTNEQLLTLYGTFKQATLGDMPASTKEPFKLQIEAHGKYKAWLSRKGMSKEAAMSKYIEFAALCECM